MANYGDVIDLSDSFILADHRALTNVVIELDTDESGLIELDSDNSIVDLAYSDITTSTIHSQAVQARKSKKKIENDLLSCIYHKNQTHVNSQKIGTKIISIENQSKFGDCPICFDPLGNNPLASTKCGHVYCMKCIKQYLLVDRRCPTCRQNLKGKSSYHPLYLNN